MGTDRVIRGGSWNDDARNVRAACRNANHPANRDDNLGFRLSRAHRGAGWPLDDPALVQPRAWLGQRASGPRCVSRSAERRESSPAAHPLGS